MNRTSSILLWLIVEALIIAGFLHFGQNDTKSHLTLNVIVSTIILSVFIMSLFGKNERSAKKGVGKGMKWFFTLTYGLLAIGAMLYFAFLNPVDMLTQTIIQLIFLSVLFMGMWGAFKPIKKAEQDNKYMILERQQLNMIRNEIRVASVWAERRADIPRNIKNSILELKEEAYLISPGNEYIALKMEGRIMLEINQIITCLRENPLNINKLHYSVKYSGKLLREFRNTYSTHQLQQFA